MDGGGQTPEDYFTEKYVMMESYQDSCFIYDRKHNIGCCIYGTPCFWINADKRKAQSYTPSFFDKSGNYLFYSLDREFLLCLKTLTQKYEHAIMQIKGPNSIQKPFSEYATATEKIDTVAYHAVIRYSPLGIEIVCKSLSSKTNFIQYSKTKKNIVTFKSLWI